jgi:cell wall assembly regulator SMI1
MLTEQLLDRLTATWRAHGVPVEEALAPGRDVSSFTSDDGTLHVELVTELQTWWAWRDGHIRDSETAWAIGPLFEQMSSTRSRVRWQRSMAMAKDAAADAPEGTPLTDPDYWWRESWVPLASDGSGYIVADCALGGPELAPIHRIEWQPDMDVDPRPRVDSFGQLVEWWIEAVELGIWTYDCDANIWLRAPWTRELQSRYRGLI